MQYNVKPRMRRELGIARALIPDHFAACNTFDTRLICKVMKYESSPAASASYWEWIVQMVVNVRHGGRLR